MGQVCAKHDEYYEKVCPWCEAPEIATDSPLIISAEEFNAHIAEAAAQAPPPAHPLLIRWPKDKAT